MAGVRRLRFGTGLTMLHWVLNVSAFVRFTITKVSVPVILANWINPEGFLPFGKFNALNSFLLISTGDSGLLVTCIYMILIVFQLINQFKFVSKYIRVSLPRPFAGDFIYEGGKG